MKKTHNRKLQKNLLFLSIACFVLLSLSYIVCIYKTVVLASYSEANNKAIATLSASINEKEFQYIEKISDIDLDKAIALGYKKNAPAEIAYFSINDKTEVALR